MTNHMIYVNRVICDSIPIDKSLKRRLLNQYRRLVDSNGPKYAADVFKRMSEVCMAYRADPRRIENLPRYLKSFPLKYKGWVRKIFKYMDCQPMYMLDFLKLYCGMGQPLVTVAESAIAQKQYLENVEDTVSDKVPGFLTRWLDIVLGPLLSSNDLLALWILEPDDLLVRFLKLHCDGHCIDYNVYKSYWLKWNSILRKFHRTEDSEAIDAMMSGRVPVPEVYKDFILEDHSSRRMEEDYWAFAHLLQRRRSYPFVRDFLSDESIEFLKFINSHHPDAFNLWIDDIGNGNGGPWLPESGGSDLYAACAGEIHHIPKKGTTKRRPIAVPNRFLQMGLVPFQMQLEAIIRRLPCDCTFDQARFDVKITNRVSNPNLYVGSVDLSQATDNFPSSWGWAIWDKIVEYSKRTHRPIGVAVTLSSSLFHEVSSGPWMNGDYPSYWTVGQPLGTLPSFDFLALSHNCLLEALAFARGLSHSPYAVLGDDVLIFNKGLRHDYIMLLSAAGVPLSKQKSYVGNLVEFAGKIFIRNQVPKYRSDHRPITYEALFDYQRSTGVSIDFRRLPEKLRRKFTQKVVTAGLTVDDGVRVYNLIVTNLVKADLDPSILLKDTDLNSAFWVELTADSNEVIPDPFMGSGVVALSGHPVTLGDYGYAEKDGHLQRFRQIQLPKWYKDKVRPYTTDKLISVAVAALIGNDHSKESKAV